MPPVSRSDIHTTGATASVLSFITWLLGRTIFHGAQVPPEVTGVILLTLPYAASLVGGYAVRRRLMADARAAAYVMGLAHPAQPAPEAVTGPAQPPTAP